MFLSLSQNMQNFYNSLHVMGFGMLGIFLVILVIYGSIYLLGKLPEKKDK